MTETPKTKEYLKEYEDIMDRIYGFKDTLKRMKERDLNARDKTRHSDNDEQPKV